MLEFLIVIPFKSKLPNISLNLDSLCCIKWENNNQNKITIIFNDSNDIQCVIVKNGINITLKGKIRIIELINYINILELKYIICE